MRRPLLISAAVLAAFVAGLYIVRQLGFGDGPVIRARYGALTTALSLGDTNAVLALIAPQYRKEFDDLRLMRMERFAKPLGPNARILVIGSDATVWPGVNRYFWAVLPIGDTVEMTKVAGNWFFTGKVHLD
jgi:hypothetical protein